MFPRQRWLAPEEIAEVLDEKEAVRISKFLCYVLRHRPEVIGLELESGGWADVDELIERANASGRALTRDLIGEVAARDGKKRLAFSEDGSKIRAAQGHSIRVDLGLKPVQPPEVLYHGTASRFVISILRQGLRPGSRHHVHLSLDEDTAAAVGRRYGRPVVLRIRAGDMWRAGIEFYCSENGVWLTANVPPEFVERSY